MKNFRTIERRHALLSRIIGSNHATGQLLHGALRAYQEAVKVEYQDSTDGRLSDNGKTKIDQINTVMTYLSDQDIGQLDFHGCDQVFGIVRRRPASKRYEKPMARKSCAYYIGKLGRSYRWLHRSTHFRWRKPEFAVTRLRWFGQYCWVIVLLVFMGCSNSPDPQEVLESSRKTTADVQKEVDAIQKSNESIQKSIEAEKESKNAPQEPESK